MTVYRISCCTCRSPNIVPTDQHCHKTLISQMTVYGISHCTCRSPNIAPADLPLEWQFHRFLLWQLIFHSYFESSSFGRPGPDRSSPIQWWFYRFLFWQLSTLRAYHLADQVLADLSPTSNGNFTDYLKQISFLLWELNIWLTRSWQIYPPPSTWQFHRWLLYSGISYLHLQITKCWQIYPAMSNANFTDWLLWQYHISPTLIT